MKATVKETNWDYFEARWKFTIVYWFGLSENGRKMINTNSGISKFCHNTVFEINSGSHVGDVCILG